ncbi:MAG: hypothetical protein QXF52_06180 [Thermoproteota archaeon]
MQPYEKSRRMLILLLALIVVSNSFIIVKTSGQVYPQSDLYVYVKVNMDENAIAVYNVNVTMGPKSVNALSEADWTLRIQLPKGVAPNLVTSTDMPKVFLSNGEKVQLYLEHEADYDYLVANIPPVEGEKLNATIRIGLVQRWDIVGGSVGFNLPILTGFNIIPELVNFTLLTSGRIESYSQYLLYFNPISSNNTVIGLWNTYFRPTTVSNITGRIFFEAFEKCLIETLSREIMVTEQLQVSVRDRLKVRYAGSSYASEILKISIPTSMSQAVKVRDALGLLYTSSSNSSEANMSIITVSARYSLSPEQQYEATVEYNLPLKNLFTGTSEGLTIIRLKDLPSYTDIVNNYSLNVKVEGKQGWRMTVDSTTVSVEDGGTFSKNMSNVMPDILAQPLEISFHPAQLEAGRSLSIILGLLTIFVLAVVDLFREKTVKPGEELKEEKEIETLIDKMAEALHEKIDYESRLEEVKVKNALGKISSKEYKASVEEYGRRISGAEKRVLKNIEQISLKNLKVGEEVKRSYTVFEEIDVDLRRMLDNTIERFRSGRITRSVFENLSGKYLKDNRKRRESAIGDVYRSIERLRS